ncbi:MAG: glycosyltransferase [Candidatus Polarisedimenticolia bacterium]
MSDATPRSSAGPLPRIIHLASGREWRGGQNQVWLLARALQARPRPAIRQIVITGAGSELERRLRAFDIPVRAPRWNAGVDPRAIWAALREARRGPAILHAHDSHAVTIAGVAALLTGRSFVATRRVDVHMRRLGFWKSAAAVIAVSSAVRDVVVSDGIPMDRVRVIHSGIALEDAVKVVPADLRSRLGLPADATIAINVAALVAHKDQLLILEAGRRIAARLPRLHWVIVGEGEMRQEIEARAAAGGLAGRVHLLGYVNDPLRQIAGADFLVLTSRKEGLGNALLEAMALGVPVIAAEAGGMPEIVRGDSGIRIPPGDPDALAEAMVRLASDPEERRRYSARGREEVRRFDHGTLAAQVAELYRQVAGGRPPEARVDPEAAPGVA